MGVKSSIEWTDATWNPVRGCSMAKGSETGGCLNCYAAREAIRHLGRNDPFHGFARMTDSGPRWTGKVELVEKHLDDPLHWRKPRRVFVNSMSDLFHESLPDEAIDRIFAVMALCPQHTFQVLTKRPERMRVWSGRSDGVMDAMRAAHGNDVAAIRWPVPNVWLGVSVENQKTADARIPLLLQTPAAIRFVSYEPALEAVDLSHHGCGALPIYREAATVTDRCMPSGVSVQRPGRRGWIRHDGCHVDWVIVGGESGPGARPFNLRWAHRTIEQCAAAGVACFVKQLGAKAGMPSCADFACTHPDCSVHWLYLRDRKGGDPSEWPAALRVRQFPRLDEASHVG